MVWSKKVIDAIRGTNLNLEDELDKVFAGTFQYQGQQYDCIPKECCLDTFLQEYYDPMRTKKD